MWNEEVEFPLPTQCDERPKAKNKAHWALMRGSSATLRPHLSLSLLSFLLSSRTILHHSFISPMSLLILLHGSRATASLDGPRPR